MQPIMKTSLSLRGISLAIAAFVALAAAGASALRAPAQALADEGNGMIEVVPISAAAGASMSWGACPCFRWSVRVQGLGGRIETRDFLISSDALFQMQESRNMQFARVMSQIFNVGAIEALWKGGHIGLGFEGITFGDDLDQNYTDIIRTGLYALINIVYTEAVRLDIRSGYQFDLMSINMSDAIERHRLTEQILFQWQTGAWSGNVRAGVNFSPDISGWDQLGITGGANVHVTALTLGDLRVGLGLDVSASHDPFRELYGLAETNVTGMLMMDLSWVSSAELGPRE